MCHFPAEEQCAGATGAGVECEEGFPVATGDGGQKGEGAAEEGDGIGDVRGWLRREFAGIVGRGEVVMEDEAVTEIRVEVGKSYEDRDEKDGCQDE